MVTALYNNTLKVLSHKTLPPVLKRPNRILIMQTQPLGLDCMNVIH